MISGNGASFTSDETQKFVADRFTRPLNKLYPLETGDNSKRVPCQEANSTLITLSLDLNVMLL